MCKIKYAFWLIQRDSCLQLLRSNGPKPCLGGLKGVSVEDSLSAPVHELTPKAQSEQKIDKSHIPKFF